MTDEQPITAAYKIPLGEILIRRGLISKSDLIRALTMQKVQGCRLGDILISEGMIGYYDLYHAIAESCGLPFVDLLQSPPEKNLPHIEHADMYLHLRLIPWRREDLIMIIAVSEINAEVMTWIRLNYGLHTRLVITSPHDIRRTVEDRFGGAMEKASCLSLWQSVPDASARVTLYPRQKKFLWLLLLCSSAMIIADPMLSILIIIAICHIAYAASMIFKCGIFAVGTQATKQQDWDARLAEQDLRELPLYSIMVPMYKEAASLPSLLHHLGKIDYPTGKLDIKLLLESDDHETLATAYALKPSYQFDIIRVPSGNPRTKPKACNYGLRFCRGEYITIFDADDRPEPFQLRKAIYTFNQLPDSIVCLQARLNYYNAGTNLLTRFFSLEYTILFDVLLQGLQHFGIPIPLGGTSNHFDVAKLRALGEWDPYNVTEDADLGTRLAARGFHTCMLDAVTLEEAPFRMGAWIRQRSRWIKGYMQTWLVHMRKPATLYRTLGWKSFMGFQFFIGLSSFTFLTAPLAWGVSLVWMAAAHRHEANAFPGWLAWLTIINLGLNLVSHWYNTLYCIRLKPISSLSIVAAALLYPLYMLLHTLASYKGLWQLIVKPHFWEKTTHGIDICPSKEGDLANLTPVMSI